MREEEQKKIEKILKELANLQVKACVLSSQNMKQKLQAEPVFEEMEDLAGEVEQVGTEFTEITRKLAKKLQSPSIEKTLNKLELTSFYNPGLATFYLTQLVQEMKGVAEKANTILSVGKIEAQYKAQFEQKRIEAEAKKASTFEVEVCKPFAQPKAEVFASQMI